MKSPGGPHPGPFPEGKSAVPLRSLGWTDGGGIPGSLGSCVCVSLCVCACVCVCVSVCVHACVTAPSSVSDAPPLWPSWDSVPRASAPQPPHLDVAGAHTGTPGCPSNRPWASPRLLLSASCSQTRPLEAGSAGLPRAGSPELSAPGSPFPGSLAQFSPAPRTPWAGSVGAVG